MLTRPTAFRRTQPPSAEPLTVAEALRQLRMVEGQADLTHVADLIADARDCAETRTERALITQTWEARLDGFWSGDLLLPRPPLQSVTSIVYATDEDDGTDEVPAADYEVDVTNEPGRVRLKPGRSWPTDIYSRPGSVVVTYVAGYGASSTSVPGGLRRACRLLVGHFERNPVGVVTGTIATELPEGIETLLAREWIPWAA